MLDFIWHGFNYPDSLPGRQGYLYTWLILVIGYEVYLNLRFIRWYQIVIAGLFGYGVVIASWIFTDVEGTDVWTYVLTLLFLTLYLLLLIGRILWKYPQVRGFVREFRIGKLFSHRCLGVKVLLLVLVVVELSTNTYITSIRTVNRTSYMKHFTDAESAVAWMQSQDEGLYRTEIFDRITKNDSMMWGINTATVFSSTVSANVVDFYKSVGLGTTRVSYWYQGATPLVSAMLGVKYMLGKDDSMDNDLYDLIYSDDTGYLYQCNYSLPMSYVVPVGLEEDWNLSSYNPVKAQNKLCKLLGVSGDLLVPVDSNKADDRNYTISVDEDAYIYVYLGNNALSEVKMTIGDKSKKFTQVSFDYLLDLGLVTSGTEVALEVVKEDQKFKTFQAYELNRRVLAEAIDILSQSTLDITGHGADYVKGQATLNEAGKLVFSIPMEKGWTLYINGEERPIETFEDTFMAVTLEPGSYEVALEFETPGMKAGMLLSMVCIAMFVVCLLVEYPPKKRVKKIK